MGSREFTTTHSRISVSPPLVNTEEAHTSQGLASTLAIHKTNTAAQIKTTLRFPFFFTLLTLAARYTLFSYSVI